MKWSTARRGLLTNAEAGKDLAGNGAAGDLAARASAERTDGQAKGEQEVLCLIRESKRGTT